MITRNTQPIQPDPRAAELQMLAALEHIRLPMTIDDILRHEDRGNVVDLRTGAVTPAPTVTATGLGTVTAYRLANQDGGVR